MKIENIREVKTRFSRYVRARVRGERRKGHRACVIYYLKLNATERLMCGGEPD